MEKEIKARISWIDTAKGICILLVVLQHASLYTHIEYPLQSVFLTFRMPLYFVLSGLFFKKYDGMMSFAKRKLNKLIIPYIFFYILGGVLLPIFFYRLFEIRIWFYTDYGFNAFKWIFSEKVICNPSIWFLVCLFEVNILFYLITWIVMRNPNTKSHVFLIVFLSFLGGVVGILLYILHINIPYFVDSSLSALPFFCFGWVLRNKTIFLYLKKNGINVIISILLIIGSLTFIHFFNHDKISIRTNTYDSELGILELYPYGLIGTICVLSLARLLGQVPLISYLGRYSIVVLCTHVYFIQLSSYLVSLVSEPFLSPVIHLFSIFILIVMLCSLFVPLFVKYLGYFTAQKDLIKI